MLNSAPGWNERWRRSRRARRCAVRGVPFIPAGSKLQMGQSLSEMFACCTRPAGPGPPLTHKRATSITRSVTMRTLWAIAAATGRIRAPCNHATSLNLSANWPPRCLPGGINPTALKLSAYCPQAATPRPSSLGPASIRRRRASPRHRKLELVRRRISGFPQVGGQPDCAASQPDSIARTARHAAGNAMNLPGSARPRGRHAMGYHDHY